MSLKHTRQIAEFTAQGAGGRAYVVQVIQEFIDVGCGELAPGLKSLRTDEGLSVNRIERGSYELVQTGEPLTSDDPRAP
ncbi:MAG: hypothetical protein WD768_22730 [Phycisphaeraceae bacterium]